MKAWLALLCVALAPWMASPALGGRQTFVLRDHLNVAWKRELVSFPFAAAKGECHPDSLTLKGPTGAVPVQLSRTTFWPGEERFVKSAKVWFIVDLAPLETREYTLDYGPKPLAGKALKTDLEIKKQGKGLVELSTSRFGIKLLVGRRTYSPAKSPEKAPGPIESMRLANGTWFGGSHLYGKTKIERYWARLTAEGPVYAEVTCRYVYADGNAFTLVAQVAAGDSAVWCDLNVEKDRPTDGCRIILSKGLPPLVHPFRYEFDNFTRRTPGARVGVIAQRRLDEYRKELVTTLTPWNDWWNSFSQTNVRFKIEKCDTELQIISRDAGAWVVPAKPGTMRIWSAWHHKKMAVKRSEDGEVYLDVNLAAGPAGGVRKWSLGEGQAPAHAGMDMIGRMQGRLQVPRRDRSAVGRRLDVVKDYVLDWPRKPGATHPRLFFTQEELIAHRKHNKPDPRYVKWGKRLAGSAIGIEPSHTDSDAVLAFLATGDLDMARKGKFLERLKRRLSLLGEFDVMRSTVTVAAFYDAIVDSGLASEAEKSLLRAQMVYLGYHLADPFIWSAERGYRSYNPNMSVSYILSLGMIACLFPDHPKAKEWVQPAINRMRIWMARDVGPKGTWPESTHYAHVSTSVLLSFAVAAKRAGFHDFFEEGTLKRLVLYLAKTYTPPDPMRGHFRVSAPFGRSMAGSRFGLVGAMAKATAESDPEFSRVMQWVWKGTGYSTNLCTDCFGSQQMVYLNKRLPAEAPNWTSDHFPNSMTILRHGVGTPYEHYINVLTNSRILFARPSGPGSLMKVFFKGRPVGGAWQDGDYHHRQELMMSRVLPARSVKDAAKLGDMPLGHDSTSRVAGFAAQARLDYLDAEFRMLRPSSARTKLSKTLPDWPPAQRQGKPPIQWRRQVLFIKDDDPAKANYLLLRDTVSGGQPTMWQFWTLSEKIGTPDQTKDLKAFLTDKPGHKPAPCRELRGDRFTAVGQFDLDLEYYVAAPNDTPRYTLRYGTKLKWPIHKLPEYQDLLNLRLPGDGHYFVVLYPRLRGEPAPTFTTLASGTVIQVEGRFGRDYGFLSATETEAQTDRFRFKGKAGCIQERGGEVVLALGAGGEIRYEDISLAAKGAASVRRHKGRIRVSLPADHPGTRVRLKLPGRYTWSVARRAGRSSGAGVCTLSAPAGVTEIDLIAQ